MNSTRHVSVAPSSHRQSFSFPAATAVIPARSVACGQERLTFAETFGIVGPPLVLAVGIGIVWAAMLLVLTLDPNGAVNQLMGTSTYEDGMFWSIPAQASGQKIATVVGLAITECYYVSVLLDMMLWRKEFTVTETWLERWLNHWRRSLAVQPREGAVVDKWIGVWRELTSLRGTRRKYWNLVFKCVDLAMQSTTLYYLLEAGLPVGFAYGYASVIAANAWTRAIVIIWEKHSALDEVVLDSMFGATVAVLSPLSILIYSYLAFTFDHGEYRIFTEVLPLGSFERRARTFADPVQITMVRTGLDLLRIRSTATLILRVGMNLSYCSRISSIVTQLIREQRKRKSRASESLGTPELAAQKPVPRVIADLLGLFGALVLFYTHKCISTSSAQCLAYPSCVSYAYRWSSGAPCPCLALIDVDKAPKTFDEWENPRDVTDDIRALADAGSLKILQLINRNLQELPDELSRCPNLHILSLIHSGLERLPPWAPSTWTSLEFMHIEGKPEQQNVAAMPADMFASMPSLQFLHLGILKSLRELPALAGASRLHMLALAHLVLIEDLPPLDSLTSLKSLELTNLVRLRRLPDLTRLGELRSFAIYRSNQICCDGFMGECNLTDARCAADASTGVPAAECLAQDDPLNLPTAGTSAMLHRFNTTICQRAAAASALALSDAPTRAESDVCGGVPYRQCVIPLSAGATVSGMCYNNRMQVLSCTADPAKATVRRLQIQRGVGPPCDPTVERWLGCQ